jgi:ribosome-associated toxin RatA of RatAB toxin-antitoxin module
MEHNGQSLVVKDGSLICGSVDQVYSLLWNAADWPRFAPHVREVEMLEESSERQHFRMCLETDGRAVVVETKRTGLRNRSIGYVQCRPPYFLKRHQGMWTITEKEHGVCVSITHEVVVDEEKALEVLGGASLDDAKKRIAETLSRNGLRMIEAIRSIVERSERPNPRGSLSG